MPNWAYTTMHVEGTPANVRAFHARFCRKRENMKSLTGTWQDTDREYVDHVDDEPVISMWNIIEPEDKERYFRIISSDDPEHSAHPDNWYQWNCRNWGTKWDMIDAKFDDSDIAGDFGTIVYEYATAWGPPIEFMKTASEMFPVLIRFEGVEEGGYKYLGTCDKGAVWYDEHPMYK